MLRVSGSSREQKGGGKIQKEYISVNADLYLERAQLAVP